MMRSKSRLGVSSGLFTGILSFLLPVFLTVLAFAVSGIHPFGSQSTLLIDSKLQYVSFFSEYMRQASALEIPLFSRFFGLGMNFFGTWAYYLASPVNILVLLFPKTNLLDGMFTILLIKVGLCGAAFYLYAGKTLASDNWKSLLFSTSYAMCGYVIAYSDNMQWLDGVIWLPVLIMGIEAVYRKGHCSYYTFIVAVLVISNFYIAVLTGVFCLLYTVYVVFRENKEDFPGKKWKFLLKVGLHSLLGVGMASFVLIPVLYILGNQMNSIGQAAPAEIFTVNPLRTIGGLFAGRTDYFFQDSLPKIYSGLLAIAAAPFYFFSEKIKKREKTALLLFLAFVFLCFHVSFLNFIWHGLDIVGWFPYRYSFVLSFLILTIGIKAVNSPETVLTEHKVGGVVYICAAMITGALSLIFACDMMGSALLVIMLAANLVILFSYFYLLGKNPRSVIPILILVCLELLMSTILGIITLNSGANYADYYAWTSSYQAVEEVIEENNLREMPGRTSIALETITGNDPLLFGLAGLDFYSSAGNSRVSDALYNLGYQRYISEEFETSDNGGSQLMNSLMGVSATIVESTAMGSDSFTTAAFPVRHQISEELLDELKVIDNPQALSLAYLVDEEVLEYSTYDTLQNPFKAADQLLSAMVGVDGHTYEEIPFAEEYSNLQISAESSDFTMYQAADLDKEASVSLVFQGKGENTPLYMNLGYGIVAQSEIYTEMSVKIHVGQEEQVLKYPDPTDLPFVLSLGAYPEGEAVTVVLNFTGMDLYVFYLRIISQDSKVVADALAPLYENQADMTWTSSSSIRITETADKSGVLFVTVPYDDGWRALVNGEPAELLIAADAFIGIQLDEGENIIEMSFFPAGLKTGIYVSLGCLAAAVIQLAVLSRRKKSKPPVSPGKPPLNAE